MAKIVITQLDLASPSTDWTDVNGDGSLYRFTKPTSTFDVASFEVEPDSVDAAISLSVKKSNKESGVTESSRVTFPMLGNVYSSSAVTILDDILTSSIQTTSVLFESQDITRGKLIHFEVTPGSATTGTLTFYDDLK